jgi:hypothetical protein
VQHDKSDLPSHNRYQASFHLASNEVFTDHIQFIKLSLIDGVVWLFEITTGVLHLFTKKECIKLIADIIMELNEFLIVSS